MNLFGKFQFRLHISGVKTIITDITLVFCIPLCFKACSLFEFYTYYNVSSKNALHHQRDLQYGEKFYGGNSQE